MIKKPKKVLMLIFIVGLAFSSCNADKIIYFQNIIGETEGELDLSKTVPAGANSWVINSLEQDQTIIYDNGIHNWTSLDDVIRTYVKTGSGQLNVGLNMKSAGGASKIKVTIGNDSKEIVISNSDYKVVEVGTFTVASGYNYIEIQGIEKSGTYIGDVNDVLLGGAATSTGIDFVPTDNFYFGRRGASVNIGYDTPSGKDVQWFYNEVTVPKGEDVIGSFFMANGHSQGYFGMQVNSETERRILFSIWSAYETDNPNQIPDDYKVTELGSGNGVTVQDFGNEGSGKQSFKLVDWKAGTTYKFLLKGEPANVAGSTNYTAYFLNPEVGDWELIASLRRPQTTTYLTGLHSFLENFNPSTGFITRQGEFGNQWAYTTDHIWNEVTRATFGVDATASNGDRFDYAGSTSGNKFIMKNCGFFNNNTSAGTSLSRAVGTAPSIDFSLLPEIMPLTSATLIDRSDWTIQDYSTQEDQGGEGSTGLAAHVLDGNLDTYWHSCWNGCNPNPPHHITIDMGVETKVDGLRFAQRQTLSRAVKDIEIQISTNNTIWTSLGNFVLQNIAKNQDIDFISTQTFRYLKFISTTAHDGTDNAAISEIIAYTR